MGKYAIIVVLSLLMILAFFVFSNNGLSSITQSRNISAYHQNQARNNAHSAAQIAVSQIIQGSNNTTFTGVVYAPEADIDIYGTKFTLKGAILGKNIKIRCSLFYDEALSEFDSSEIITDRYYVLSWQ